jgi:hypothetical protein
MPVVPLALLPVEPFGDCCVPLPVALMPLSVLPPGVATMPESEAPLLGAMAPDVPPPAPICAKAVPEAARLKHRLLAINKRDMISLLIGSCRVQPAGVT